MEVQPAEIAPAPASRTDDELSMLAQISRTMVRLYKEQFGRGPKRARTEWAGRDILICVLEDSMTPTEKNLRSLGEDQRLRDIRMLFQYASAQQFIEPVEEITGRRVRSFISGMDTENDVAIETFIFHPGE